MTERSGAAQRQVAAEERRIGAHVVSLHHPSDHHRAADLLQRIWERESGPPLNSEMLRAFEHTGNYVGAAFDGDEMVGVAVAFRTDHDSLHSHIAGILPDHQGRSIGYLLKLHQRAWALDHGVSSIAWTFDPLVRRNAYFNLVKLGAGIAEYLPDFYGAMADAINAGVPSDRMVASWRLADPVPGQVLVPAVGHAAAVTSDSHDRPVAHDVRADAAERTFALPEDIEALRVTDPPAALAWRHTLRNGVLRSLADGYRIVGFTAGGAYLARKEDVR